MTFVDETEAVRLAVELFEGFGLVGAFDESGAALPVLLRAPDGTLFSRSIHSALFTLFAKAFLQEGQKVDLSGRTDLESATVTAAPGSGRWLCSSGMLFAESPAVAAAQRRGPVLFSIGLGRGALAPDIPDARPLHRRLRRQLLGNSSYFDYQTAGVVDLDTDGKAEILLWEGYRIGQGYSLFRQIDGSWQRVLRIGSPCEGC